MNEPFPYTKKKLVPYILLLSCSSTQPLFAQEQDRPAFLEEVIVTAERREADLQDTPIAVTAFTADQITQLGALGVEDLQTFTPNLSITEDGDYGRMNPQFNIRGVGAGVPTAGVVTERPVGLYVDGVFLARAQGSLLSVLDAQSIEVLRGPQGTLFGRNTTGGAVVYTSRKPENEFAASAQLTVGNFDRNDQQFSLNIPLSDAVAVRAVYANSFTDGYVRRGDRLHGDRDEEVARLQLSASLSDSVKLDLSATNTSFSTTGDTRVLTEFNLGPGLTRGHFAALETALVAQGEAPFTNDDPRLVLGDYEIADYCVLNDPNPYSRDESCDNGLDASMSLLTGNLTWDFNENLTLKSITGYLDGDQQGSSDFPWTGAYKRPFDVEFETFSQEFQAVYQSEKLKAVGGFIYYNEDASETEVTIATSLNFGRVTNVSEEELLAGEVRIRRDERYEAETTSLGAYIQGTYSITDALDLTAGVRHSSDEKDVSIDYVPTADDRNIAFGQGEESWDNTDYRLALSYRVNDDLMFYGSVTEAYKAGIANDASIENQLNNVDTLNEAGEPVPVSTIGFIDPEEALGYEIGMRSEWFDNRFRANLTVFKTDYTNRQSQIIRLSPGAESAIIETVNIGDVNFQGIEGEFVLAVTQDFTLNASFGVTDYEQVENPDFTLPFLPEESFSIGANYDFNFGNGAKVMASLNYGWQSEMWSSNELPADESIVEQVKVDEYGLLNGRLTYIPESAEWSIAVFANNITDEVYFTNGNAQVFHFGLNGPNGVTRTVGRPQAYGVTGTMNF